MLADSQKPSALPSGMVRTGAAWAFFGSNMDSVPLLGKPEHVDELRPGALTVHIQETTLKAWETDMCHVTQLPLPRETRNQRNYPITY